MFDAIGERPPDDSSNIKSPLTMILTARKEIPDIRCDRIDGVLQTILVT